MNQEIQPDVGRKIRELRGQQNLSLRALAEGCGLSINAISRIERGENSPTVSTLHRLATALDVPITAFFMEEAEQVITFVQREARLRYQADGLVMESLGSGLSDQRLEPFHITIEPGNSSLDAPISHPGEEFIHCLKGKLDYWVNDQVYHLKAGDSLLFKATQPHCWSNTSQAPAMALLIFQATSSHHLLHHRPLGM